MYTVINQLGSLKRGDKVCSRVHATNPNKVYGKITLAKHVKGDDDQTVAFYTVAMEDGRTRKFRRGYYKVGDTLVAHYEWNHYDLEMSDV